MKKFVLLFFIFSLLVFANPATGLKDSVQKDQMLDNFNTLKDKLKNEFDNIKWIKNTSLKTQSLPMPYNLEELETNSSYLFASIGETNQIHPELKDLGTLNFFGVEDTALHYCETLSKNIITRQISESEISSERPFLKYFFEYKLLEYPNLPKVFYGRPEVYDNKMDVTFRLNFSHDSSRVSYAIVKSVAIYENENWKLYEFNIGDIKYEKFE